MSESIPSEVWILVVGCVGLICLLAGWDVTKRLWAFRKVEPPTPPYDWQKDESLAAWHQDTNGNLVASLAPWDRDAEGELVAVFPVDWEIAWRYK